MLDVHAPEHPIHGVRDFFLHLFTITIGLLIALGLENFVGWRHHVHLRHQAEATMRREIEGNRHDLHVVLGAIPEEMQHLGQIQTFLQAIDAGNVPPSQPFQVGIAEATLEDAAWSSSNATGALSYMDFDEVQRFSLAYQMQRKFDQIQDQAVPPMIVILAAIGMGDAGKMSREQAAATLQQVHLTMAHLKATAGMGQELDRLYSEALQAK